MPFTLKVAKGAGAGAEFPFDTNEARLGRTADNDIVVKDSGASRSHARVYQKGARYFVEDLKSANGTKVNNSVVTGSKEIKNGDTITIGEVVFTFSFADDEPEPAVEADAPGGAMATVIKKMDDITGEAPEPVEDGTSESAAFDPSATMLKASQPVPKTHDPERERRTTGRGPAAKPKPDGPKIEDAAETQPTPKAALVKAAPKEVAPKEVAPPPPADKETGGTMEVAMPPALVRRGGGSIENDDEKDELTAADKLRMRRQAQKTTWGRIAYQFDQMGKVGKTIIMFFAVAFIGGIAGLVIWTTLPAQKKKVGPEPLELSAGGASVEPSFGLGEGVTYERADMKVFNFTAASATRIVGVLHYQAKDISKDEVAVSINGYDLGFIPPDTLDTANRELEQVLPAGQVKKGEANQIIFDNTRNPPQEDPWRVWNLWLELIAIPDLSPEETVNAVKDDMERSQKFYERRDIGPDNLFKSWKGYRDAWLKMESMPARPDELYVLARQQQREMGVLLDKRCSMMVLDFQKAMSSKKPDRKRGRQVAEEMLRYFPSREHRCHALARDLIEETGGFGSQPQQ